MTRPARGTRAAHAPGDARAVGQVVLAALGFSLISIFTIIATRRGTPLTMLLAARYVVAAVALLPALGWLTRHPMSHGRLWPLFLVGAIGQATVAILSLSALAFIPAATLVFLFYTFPAWVTLISAARGLERLDRRKLVALGVSLAGLGLLVGLPGAASIHPTGVVLALSASVAYAIYIPVMGHLQRDVDASFTTLLVATGCAAIFLAASLVRGEFSLALDKTSWGAIVAVGLFCTAAAFRLFLSGLAVLGPVRTSIVCTVEPLFAAVLAAVILDQPITPPVVAGGALILAAVVGLQLGSAPGPATGSRR
ncbi:MAG: EamA family transporter [Cytophagaceae bacterium]|nr:EamA family transporter [Gemmatimonadaceae bacterium]